VYAWIGPSNIDWIRETMCDLTGIAPKPSFCPVPWSSSTALTYRIVVQYDRLPRQTSVLLRETKRTRIKPFNKPRAKAPRKSNARIAKIINLVPGRAYTLVLSDTNGFPKGFVQIQALRGKKKVVWKKAFSGKFRGTKSFGFKIPFKVGSACSNNGQVRRQSANNFESTLVRK